MKINYFCYPYGGKESFNDNTLKILNKMGFNYCFGLNYLPINKKVNFYNIPRMDCNQFSYGKAD